VAVLPSLATSLIGGRKTKKGGRKKRREGRRNDQYRRLVPRRVLYQLYGPFVVCTHIGKKKKKKRKGKKK